MSLKEFEAHLRDPKPGFRCYSTRDKSDYHEFLAQVKNRVSARATETDFATVAKQFGKTSPSFVEFFKLHDGVVLYCDLKSDTAGVEFFPVQEWSAKTREMRDEVAAMGFDEGDMPDWYHSGIVFGEIPHSGNYFSIQPGGSSAGQIFYFDHDDFRTEPMAESFDQFLAAIISDPPGFLYECGCFARYSDSKTDIQWIPKAYLANCSGS